ncbi:four-carbon acid sugar kinase family protein [Roseibium algae]|uniref:Four-carbon acid sugar kinase family protein n=1 Tax=Roseibium algae TaxID=3123038 RepID=A0ABU8TS26_9HYPH
MMRKRPLSVFIGDDFTGASDTLATWARSGAQVRLYLDAETASQAGDSFEVIGIATELRGLTEGRIRSRLPEIATTVAGLNPEFVHYKVCSTFDSSPDTGSIGAAVDVLEQTIQPCLTLVIGGQPSLGRYCLFGNLFARASDKKVYRIDRHPVMRCHPITPMAEADLSVHLAAQGLEGLQSISVSELAYGARELVKKLHTSIGEGSKRFLIDASSADDIRIIGEALGSISKAEPVLLVGASSVAEAIAYGSKKYISRPSGIPIRERKGPCLMIAGSRSSVTEYQVSSASSFEKLELSPATLQRPSSFNAAIRWACYNLKQGRNVLVHTLPGADYHERATDLTERLVNYAEAVLSNTKIGKLGVAGGDTSSAICQRLGFLSLDYAFDIDPGVSICIGQHSDLGLDGLKLMLKGGQMGSSGLFDRFTT